MRKITSVLIGLVLILTVSTASAGEVFQKTVNNNLPLIQANYVSNNVLGIDLKRGWVGGYRFQKPAWTGAAGEVIDYSGKGNDGVMVGGGILNSGTGKLGQAYHANGTNYFTFPPGVVNQDEGAFFAWIESNSSITTARFFGTDHTSGGLEWRMGGNGVSVALGLTIENEVGAQVTTSLPATFANDTFVLVGWSWRYVVGANHTLINAYLNGVKGIERTLAGKVAVPNVGFVVGIYPAAADILIAPASVDEFVIWERLPSADEIKHYFNATRGRYID